jgi:hypothetical protein
LSDGEVTVARHDRDTEDAQREAIRGRLDRLRSRSRRFGGDR